MTTAHQKVPVPERIARLPRDQRGYHVPFFVEWVNGVPDFRVIDGRKLVRCVNEHLCWVCGDRLGRFLAFTIGPMCAVNRISGEPPAHRDCAIYSARACPFLSNPSAPRRETHIPEGAVDSESHIRRNPGATLVWVTTRFSIVRGDVKPLFSVGDPVETLWFCEGRSATRAEVLASIESGLPLLRAEAEKEGPRALAALEQMLQPALALVPA